MNLSILFRSCDRVDCFSGQERVVPAPKQELILRSLNSLLRSIAVAKECCPDVEVEFCLVDDFSSTETFERMISLCSLWGTSPICIPMEGSGNGDSLKTNYEWARDAGHELLFFVEDDYLHHPDMLTECLEFYTQNVGVRPGMDDMVIHPCDYPDRYYRDLYRSWILPGKGRHWRSILHTTCTFLMSRRTLEEHWDNYMGFTRYGKDPGVTEDTTINKVYQKVNCFSPMPTLSIHLQYDSCISPFTDWQAWWEANQVDVQELDAGSSRLHPPRDSTESSDSISK